MVKLLLKSEVYLCNVRMHCSDRKTNAFQIWLQGAYLIDSLSHCALEFMALPKLWELKDAYSLEGKLWPT